MTRRRWISLAAGSAVGAAVYPAFLEPRWLELTHTKVAIGLAQPVRVLHLADLHAGFFVPFSLIERAIRIGLEQKPDVVCLTGDFITLQHDFEPSRYVELLRAITSAVPAFAVLGNHDGGKWAPSRGGFSNHTVVDQILAESHITLLHNRAQTVRVRGNNLSLVGVGDFWSEEIDAQAAFAAADTSVPTVLLSHNPDSKNTLGRYPWNLMLSGHTHGGQVLIPFKGPAYAPVADVAYVAGLKAWRDRQIFVTRGVGNLGGVRFRCRPEVSLLTLT